MNNLNINGAATLQNNFFVTDTAIRTLVRTGISKITKTANITKVIKSTAAYWPEKIVKGLPEFLIQLAVDAHAKDPNYGFIKRLAELKANMDMYDEKFFFHYCPLVMQLLRDNGVDISEHREFFDYLDILYSNCYHGALAVGREMDKLIPNHDFEGKMRLSHENHEHVIRLLYYPAASELKFLDPTKPMARLHLDRNFGTFGLFESHSGLELGLPGVPHSYNDEHALVFTGSIAAMETNEQIPPIPHSVQRTTQEARTSVVFFFKIPWDQDEVEAWGKQKLASLMQAVNQ